MASESFVFEFDLMLYRLAAIQKAAYRYSGHFDIRMESVAPDRVRVELSAKLTPPAWPCDPASFPCEVLDQDLREKVAEDTKSVRDLLLAQTFSELSFLDPAGETADYHDDPLGIAGHGSTHGT